MIRWLQLWFVLAPLLAQQPSTPPPGAPHIRVHGEATVSAQPDRVQMDIGVISQAATSVAATELNTKQANAVIAELRKLIASPNIKTVNFSVNPNYQYPKDGSAPSIQGYTANNTVRLELDDLNLLPKVIGAATGSGANNVNRVTFALRDEGKVRAEALGKAAEQAQASAQALANRLKVKLGALLGAEEEQPVVVSPGRQVELAPRAKAAQDVPVEPGTIEIHASVSLTFAISQ